MEYQALILDKFSMPSGRAGFVKSGHDWTVFLEQAGQCSYKKQDLGIRFCFQLPASPSATLDTSDFARARPTSRREKLRDGENISDIELRRLRDLNWQSRNSSKESIDSAGAFPLYLFCSEKRSPYMIQAAKPGDTVKVNYTGRSEDGSVFESSIGLMPLKFTIGSDEVVNGFENAVVGMCPGERKTVVVEPDQGYGPYDDDLVFDVPNEDLPEGVKPHIGMDFEMVDEKGHEISAVVIDIAYDSVTIDANAPLAGKSVIYDIELIEILPARKDN